MPIMLHRRDRGRTEDNTNGAQSPVLLSERVYHQFKRDIVTGVLEPGLPLTEAFLTKRFGASRTPIREACARLNNEKLLEFIPNKGYSVASISLRSIQELFQVREMLETFTVQEACGKNNPELLGKIEALGQTSSRLGDRESYLNFINANYNLHLSIAELAGNQYVIRILSDVINQLNRVGYVSVSHEDDGTLVLKEHGRIVEAIRAGDREGAKEAVLQHIARSKESILKACWR